MAPQVADTLLTLLSLGVVETLAGRVVGVEAHDGGLRAQVRLRGTSRLREVEARHVVDCSGPAPIGRTRHPVLRRLIDAGHVRPDALGLGLEAGSDGRLGTRTGEWNERLFALGPLLRGMTWEATAVAEIRGQAAALAGTLLEAGSRSDEAAGGIHLTPPRVEAGPVIDPGAGLR
jgi:uncharacterized NAD(P)/FAD-binding protein YdhS